jgi:hypothetical protein
MAEFPKEAGEMVELGYSCPFGFSAAKSIYLFDQKMARTGIPYQAELHGAGIYSRFIIRVPAPDATVVSGIIAQIGKR